MQKTSTILLLFLVVFSVETHGFRGALSKALKQAENTVKKVA